MLYRNSLEAASSIELAVTECRVCTDIRCLKSPFSKLLHSMTTNFVLLLAWFAKLY